MKRIGIVLAFIALIFSSCVSPLREVGTLEIQMKVQGASGDQFLKEGEFELVTAASEYGDILPNKKRVAGQENVYLIEETISVADLRGEHTDYLLLLSNRNANPRPHPQVIPIDLALKKARGVWTDWIAPKYIEESDQSSWNLLYKNKSHLTELKETPLAVIRYRISDMSLW